jgi:Family of unknown function (DUF5678)
METTTLNNNTYGIFDNLSTVSNFDAMAYSESSSDLDWDKGMAAVLDVAKNSTITLSSGNGAIGWLGSNWESLIEKYADRWVLVENQRIVADSNDPTELERIAEASGIREPFITKIEPVSAVWRTAYAHKGL